MAVHREKIIDIRNKRKYRGKLKTFKYAQPFSFSLISFTLAKEKHSVC